MNSQQTDQNLFNYVWQEKASDSPREINLRANDLRGIFVEFRNRLFLLKDPRGCNSSARS